jgi:hypothetical protein
MLRTAIMALAVIGALAAPSTFSTPARACGIVYVPTNTEAELAAIRKALPQAKLGADDKDKVANLMDAASRPDISKPEREKAISEIMKILQLPRIFQDQACITLKLPAVS